MDDLRLKVSGFLKQISHEIRTPMNTIVGSAELISRENVNEKVRDSILDIRQAADKMTLLIDDLIDVVRIRDGELVLHDEEYCFKDLELELRKQVERRADHRGLENKIEFDDNIPYRMFGDYNRLRQMVSRLIANAFIFTESGSVSLSVKCLAGGEGQVFLRFDVTDSGSGELDPDVVEVLNGKGANFEQGVRGVELPTIGIFLSRYIAGIMGGKLMARAKKGEGSTFSILIPQATVGQVTISDHNRAVASADDDSALFTAPDARLLLVETDEDEARWLHLLLSKYRIEADICKSCKDAVGLVKRIGYNMVIVGNAELSEDGRSVAETIRLLADTEKAEYYAQLPIIECIGLDAEYTSDGHTGNLHDEHEMQSYSEFVNDVIHAPVEIPELEYALRTFLPAETLIFTTEYSGGSENLVILEELGLNTKLALANFGGNENEYRDVLLTLCRSSDTKGKMLSHYLEQHDYKNYIVAMHGILGVTRVIGADRLAARCKELEKAATQGLREHIEKNTAKFSEDFEKLLTAVRSVIITHEDEANKGAIDKEDLLSIISELKGYLAEYQINEVEELFFTLAQFSYPNPRVVELIHEAEEHMLNYDYNSVVSTLEDIRSELLREDEQ